MTPKFCKDCRYLTDTLRPTFEKCSHPVYKSFDLVTGAPKMKYAESARSTGDLCGPAAALFEPKDAEAAA